MIANLAKQTPQLQIPKKKQLVTWMAAKGNRPYLRWPYVRVYLSSACNEIAFHFYAQNVLTFLFESYIRYEKPYIFCVYIQLPGTCLRRSICGTFLFPVPSSQLDWNHPPLSHRVPKSFSSSSQGFLVKFPIYSPRCSICFNQRLILCLCVYIYTIKVDLCVFIMGSTQYFILFLNCDGPIKVGFSVIN